VLITKIRNDTRQNYFAKILAGNLEKRIFPGGWLVKKNLTQEEL